MFGFCFLAKLGELLSILQIFKTNSNYNQALIIEAFLPFNLSSWWPKKFIKIYLPGIEGKNFFVEGLVAECLNFNRNDLDVKQYKILVGPKKSPIYIYP